MRWRRRIGGTGGTGASNSVSRARVCALEKVCTVFFFTRLHALEWLCAICWHILAFRGAQFASVCVCEVWANDIGTQQPDRSTSKAHDKTYFDLVQHPDNWYDISVETKSIWMFNGHLFRQITTLIKHREYNSNYLFTFAWIQKSCFVLFRVVRVVFTLHVRLQICWWQIYWIMCTA